MKNHQNKTANIISGNQPVIKGSEDVKASHLSSNPINERKSNNGTAHFEVEVENAFFRVFFGC